MALSLLFVWSLAAWQFPVYSAESLVNAASGLPRCWSPNTLGTLYGSNLTFNAPVSASAAAILPRELNEVAVLLGRDALPLLYVSATQVNFWIPATMAANQRIDLRLVTANKSGPAVLIDLASACPEFFADAQGFVAASLADGSVVTPSNPAVAGAVVVLYGTGFGPTVYRDGRLDRPTRADYLTDSARIVLELDGKPVPGENFFYAGLTPGYPGLYQINVTLPDSTPANPVLKLRIGAASSTREVRLAVRPGP